MKLQDKGPIKPVPVLAEPMEQVSKEIQNWKGIFSATHWNLFDLEQVDGADFYVGEQELGHIHLDGSIHLATTKELQTELVKNKLAKKFPYAQGWVEFEIATKADAAHALWLFQINYQRPVGIALPELIQQIKDKK